MLLSVSNNASTSLISTPIVSQYEDVWIQLTTYGCRLVVGCVYFPPETNVEFYRSFCHTCESLRNRFENHKFIICGDFNLPHIEWIKEDGTLVPEGLHTPAAETVVDCMFFLELQQINSVRNNRNRMLDLIFA